MKENWGLAYEDYKSGMKRKDIAEKYQVSINTVKSWKQRHWNKKEGAPLKKKKGAPLRNKNASGRTPKKDENQNAKKHGLFAKWLPEEVNQIIGEMPESPLDILWYNIQLQLAAIVRAQNIMFVADQKDKTIEKVEEKDGNVIGERWEVQQAWDKQANFMTAQSRAMKTLESMIKQYDELLHKNWELASEEQKARLGLIQAQKKKLESDGGESQELTKLDQLLAGIDQEAKS
ncbi:phage terminase small subunit [Faecalicoccus acidiformans]|uniref:phage terminase small subunit n=1 Tax=Faecalicoccus acidiformans TaxID=915173 RepID=UPI0025A3CEB1|nr:phage terminase small subunit [Faecalicoccus acidiformans]MDM8204280.1 phage terminase small subunit [Faecalicoccus acidiformans]